MARRTGGDRVVQGFYWSQMGGLVSVHDEGVLPGDDRSVYYRVPFPLLVPLGVMLGALYVAALPLAALGTAAVVLSKRLFGDLLARAREAVSFGWRPTEAYLAGKEPRKEKPGDGEGEAGDSDGRDRKHFPQN